MQLATPSGGDDQPSLQALIAGGGPVLLGSGTFNLCAGPLDLSTVSGTLSISGTGNTTVQIQTGCATPPETLVYDDAVSLPQPQRIVIQGIDWNGNCLAAHDFDVPVGHALDIKDGLIANALTSNIRLGGSGETGAQSFEHVFESAVRIQNEGSCYASPADFPAYNIDVEDGATDNTFERLIAANASVANIYDVSGGGNVYEGTHPFNFVAGKAPVALYNFWTSGSVRMSLPYADTATVAGFFVEGSFGGVQLIGPSCFFNGGPPAGAACVLLASGVGNDGIVLASAPQLPVAQVVVQQGSANPTTLVVDTIP